MLRVAAAPRSRPPKTPVTRSSSTDFGFTDPLDVPANALLNVIIVVPPSVGTLAVGGVPVASGTVIAANTISGHLLTYTPPANANGNGLANFTFRVQDDGGTANGGQDTAQAASTIGVNVTAVNDAPFFTLGQDQNATDENPATHGPALPQTIGWLRGEPQRRPGQRVGPDAELHGDQQQQRSVQRAADDRRQRQADLHGQAKRPRHGPRDRHPPRQRWPAGAPTASSNSSTSTSASR